MSLLHLLPPETAHKLALFGVKHGLFPAAAEGRELETTLLGKTFKNPIGLSAGADKNAVALAGWEKMGLGFVEAGTVTRHARAGNPKPRLWRAGDGHLVNWMGLPGEGMKPVLDRLKAFRAEAHALVIGVSISSPEGSVDDLRALAAALAPEADYLTLNISCPNVSGHAEDDMSGNIRAVVAEAGKKPLLVKLSPTRDSESLKIAVIRALDAGAAGIAACNTVPFDKRDLLEKIPFEWPVHDGKNVGGYSGSLLLETSSRMVQEIRALIGDKPLIGGGGVQSGEDAARLFDAGADLVQIYTGLVYKGAGLIKDIRKTCRARRRQGLPRP